MAKLLTEDDIEQIRRLSGLSITDIADDDILLIFSDVDTSIRKKHWS